MAVAKDNLRNRANAHDRPRLPNQLRTVPIVKADSKAVGRCKEGIGHSHIFQVKDTYGCCKVCGDEVLT